MVPVPHEPSAAERFAAAPLFDQVRRDRRGFEGPPGGALVAAVVPPRPLAPAGAMALSVPA